MILFLDNSAVLSAYVLRIVEVVCECLQCISCTKEELSYFPEEPQHYCICYEKKYSFHEWRRFDFWKMIWFWVKELGRVDLILYIRLSCHTLSKAWDASKNTYLSIPSFQRHGRFINYSMILLGCGILVSKSDLMIR